MAGLAVHDGFGPPKRGGNKKSKGRHKGRSKGRK